MFWFWINGNIGREDITKNLESMKRVGIGCVIWMEVSGPRWAPGGRFIFTTNRPCTKESPLQPPKP